MFDSLKSQNVLDLGAEWRELLGYAADLHDVGEFISYERHNIHSYTIIINAPLAGFDSIELQEMALMARFHHNSVPSPKSKLFAGLEPAAAQAVRQCALLLRMADILDRGRNGAVTGLSFSVSSGTALLRIASATDISMPMWKLKTVREDFGLIFGLRLREVHELS